MGTVNIDKIYAESFRDQAHLDAILSAAMTIVGKALTTSNPAPWQGAGRP
jgi:hypothetical protein